MPNSPPEVGIVSRIVRFQGGGYGFLRLGREELFFHSRQARWVVRQKDGSLRWTHPHGGQRGVPEEGTRVAFYRGEIEGETKVIAWVPVEEYEAALNQDNSGESQERE